MKSLIRRRLLATSLWAFPLVGGPAIAQQAAAPASASRDRTHLSEVVVTAERKSENVLAVAGSLETHTADQLRAAGILNLSGLQYTTPGYTVALGFGFAQIYIRGIGNSVFVSADPSVTTYIDDVPRVYGSFISAFTDAERVEVLKGAQGGLYGRNATGGVVNIISRQPSTSKYAADATVTYGEKDTLYLRGFINIPINDRVALSVAAERDTHGPYTTNIAPKNPYTAVNFPCPPANLSCNLLPTGPGGALVPNTAAQTAAFFNSPSDPPPLNDMNLWSVSAKLLIKPTDNFKFTLAADYAHKDDRQGLQTFNMNPAVANGLLEAAFTTPVAFGGAGLSNFTETPGMIQGTTGPFTAAKAIHTMLDVKDWGFSGTGVLSVQGFDVTSITAFRKHKPDEVDDLLEVTVPGGPVNPFRSAWFFYQEVRAVSTFDGPLHIIGGATYLHNHYEENIDDIILPPLAVFGSGPITSSIESLDNWSVYAQLAYDITSKLTLTVSGRYLQEYNTTVFTRPFASSTHTLETTFLPSAVLSYKVPGGGNVYARFAEGFKGGGINDALSPVAFANAGATSTNGSSFQPEHVDTYEVGYRSTWFDRKVQVTAAAFYNDYTNLQVESQGDANHPTIIFAIVNAGSARTYGVEGSVTWKVAEPITLGINAGYLNAKYGTFAFTGPVLLNFNRSGHQMIFAPDTQLSLTGALDQPINDKFRVVGNVLASYTSRTLFGKSALPGIIPDATQAPYWIVNLRLGLRTADDKYGIAVFADNVFNQAYSTQGGSTASIGTQGLWGEPRIVGVEVSAKF